MNALETRRVASYSHSYLLSSVALKNPTTNQHVQFASIGRTSSFSRKQHTVDLSESHNDVSRRSYGGTDAQCLLYWSVKDFPR